MNCPVPTERARRGVGGTYHIACLNRAECIDVTYPDGCHWCGHAMSGHLGLRVGPIPMRTADGVPDCAWCVGHNDRDDPGGAAQCHARPKQTEPYGPDVIQAWHDREVEAAMARMREAVPA